MAIMTGAPMPEGADAVQIVERTERPAERPFEVIVHGPIAPGDNVTLTGAQARAGEVVVEKGRIIESLTAGVLATFGAAQVEVFRRPRVTVVATGDELVSVDEAPGPAQIRDSNRKTLMALAEAEWCRVVDGGIAKDDRAHLKSVIRDGLEGDVLVLSGGVSAGSYDYVRECLEAEGVEILFHQIAIKPGKPALFGRTERSLVFGLPGNPVSTFVTAMMLLVPAVRVLGRRPDHRPWVLRLPLVEGEVGASGKRTTFHPADLVRLEDLASPVGAGGPMGLGVRPRRWSGSADHVAYARGNVLIRCEADAPRAGPGELVSVVMTRSLVDW
jgi:molybdopterin molybdotransferase